jgi:hypothetical protein
MIEFTDQHLAIIVLTCMNQQFPHPDCATLWIPLRP